MNTESVLPVVVELFAKSAFIVLAAVLLVRVRRGATSAQRHLVWVVALVAILLLPCTRFASPRWAIPLQPVKHVSVTLPAATALPPAETLDVPLQTALQHPPIRVRTSVDWRKIMLALWLGGAVFVLGYRLVGSWRVHRLYRRSVPVEDSRIRLLMARTASELRVVRRVEVRLSGECRVPITWGTWRPVLLLPREALTWSDTWLIAALRHEAAHIVRHDDLTRWTAWIACAAYWPNPFIWLAARSLRLAQEQSADDLVLSCGTPAEEYATQLVDAARLVATNGLFIRHAVAMACPSTLEDRIVAIVDGRRDRRPLSRLAALLGLVAIMLSLGLSAVAQLKGAEEKDAAATTLPKATGPQVTIFTKFIEISPGSFDAPEAFPPPASYQVYDDPQFQVIIRALSQKKGVDIMASPSITTHSGLRAVMEIGREFRNATDWSKSGDAWEPQKYETKTVGVALDVTPTIREGGDVELYLKSTYTDFKGFIDIDAPGKPVATSAKGKRLKPIFEEGSQETTVTIKSGQTVVLADIQPRVNGRLVQTTGEYRRQRVAFVTAQILEPAGATKAAAAAADEVAPSLHLNTAREAEDAAAKIIIPSVELHDATVKQAVDFLRQKSRELAAGNLIEVVLSASAEKNDRKFSLSLKNVPLADAARYVASLANLPLNFGPREILIGNPDSHSAEPAAADTPFKLEDSKAAARALRLILPRVEVHEASVQEALDFLRVKAAEIDPDHSGVNILLKLPAVAPAAASKVNPADARITLTLTNISLYEALKYVANLSELQLVIFPNALLLQPPSAGASAKQADGAPPPFPVDAAVAVVEPPVRSPTTVVTVNKSGGIFVNDEAVSEQVLEARMQAVNESDPNGVVILNGGADTPQKMVMEVLEKLHRAGTAYVVTPTLPNEGLATKVWKLDPDLVPPELKGNGAGHVFAKDWLVAKGVVFEGVASAVYTTATSQLLVRNTQSQLDLVDQIVSKQMQQPAGTKR